MIKLKDKGGFGLITGVAVGIVVLIIFMVLAGGASSFILNETLSNMPPIFWGGLGLLVLFMLSGGKKKK